MCKGTVFRGGQLASAGGDTQRNVSHLCQGWIDLSTRVVFVDMNIYNANVDMWLLMSVMAEFPATGGTVVSARCVCRRDTPVWLCVNA